MNEPRQSSESNCSSTMSPSKARRIRRKKLRTQYLTDLAHKSPKQFAKVWNWLLAGWVKEIQKRTVQLSEPSGAGFHATPSSAALRDQIMCTMESIDHLPAGHLRETLAALDHAQLVAIALAVDKRMLPRGQRLSN